MENSVKALYIAAGMLIAVMILGVWVYMFRLGSSVGQHYEADLTTQRIQAFNSQFEKYAVVTKQYGESKGYAFESKGNIGADVITCCNLAYNINKKNDYDEKNCVEIEIEIPPGPTMFGWNFKIYSLENLPREMFFCNVADKESAARITYYMPWVNVLSFQDFLNRFVSAKIVNINVEGPNGYKTSNPETIYDYYFDVNPEDIKYNEDTGKVNSIKFTAIETQEFYTNGKGNWQINI